MEQLDSSRHRKDIPGFTHKHPLRKESYFYTKDENAEMLHVSSFLFGDKRLLSPKDWPPQVDYSWQKEHDIKYRFGEKNAAVSSDQNAKTGTFQSNWSQAGFLSFRLGKSIQRRIHSLLDRFRNKRKHGTEKEGLHPWWGGGGNTPHRPIFERDTSGPWKKGAAISLFVGGILTGIGISQSDIDSRVNRFASKVLSILWDDQTAYESYTHLQERVETLAEENRIMARDPIREKLAKTRVDLALVTAELEKLKAQTPDASPKEGNTAHKRQVIIDMQKEIDAKLKLLLAARGMKPELRHEWLPKKTSEALQRWLLTDAELDRYILRQERSLRVITRKIAAEKHRTGASSKKLPLEKSSLRLAPRKIVCPAKTSSHIGSVASLPQPLMQHAPVLSTDPLSAPVYQQEYSQALRLQETLPLKLMPEPCLDPKTLNESSVQHLLRHTNELLSRHNVLAGGYLTFSGVQTKQGNGIRIFFHCGGKKAYLTLFPDVPSRNYYYVKSPESLVEWAEKRNNMWKRRAERSVSHFIH